MPADVIMNFTFENRNCILIHSNRFSTFLNFAVWGGVNGLSSVLHCCMCTYWLIRHINNGVWKTIDVPIAIISAQLLSQYKHQ